MAKENATTNHIENEADNVDSENLEVSAESVEVPKHSPFNPFLELE